MTDGQRDLFGFVGAAFAVMIGLFVVQEMYGGFVEARAQASIAGAPMFSELAAARDAESKKLATGRMPIEQATRAIAERGRTGFRSVAPVPSDDLSAMTGWIHRPHFQAYVPRAQPAPVAPPPAPEIAPAPAPEAAPVPGAKAAPEAAPKVRAPERKEPE